MADFIQTYFIDPIYYNTGYNIVNTSVFAILLVAGVFGAYKLMKMLKIDIDKKFLLSIAPFIALGGILRSFEDLMEAAGSVNFLSSFVMIDATGTARNLLLITPMIYAVMFFATLIPLLISKFIEHHSRIEYWKTMITIGVLLDLLFLIQLRFSDSFAFLAVAGITAAWVIAILGAKKISELKNMAIKNFFTAENTSILSVHMFDATTTFVALTYYPYFEQHVLPGFLISIFGPVSMFLLKLVVVSFVLYMFDKELEKEAEKRTFLKLVVLILGMGPGLRNFLRLVMGV